MSDGFIGGPSGRNKQEVNLLLFSLALAVLALLLGPPAVDR